MVNARHVQFTGRKMKDKQYYWHTLHPGGLKSRTPKELMEKDKAEEVCMCGCELSTHAPFWCWMS